MDDGAVSDVKPYDAVLLQSFGGPEGPDDVMPFLENVTRGRGIPRERLEDVAQHYLHFGGKSPINDQNKELLAALRAEFDARGLGDLPCCGATGTGSRTSPTCCAPRTRTAPARS